MGRIGDITILIIKTLINEGGWKNEKN